MKLSSQDYVELFKELFLIKNNWQNNLYIHTPFCIQKCHYCIYNSRVPDGKGEMDEFYYEVIPRQIEQYKDVLEGVKFDEVYFGGGTPTIVDAGTLEGLYRQISGFEDIPLKITESSPYTVTEGHLDLFIKYRFKYVSLGVQTLSTRVLEAQNRKVVTLEKLHHICRRLNEHGVITNIDLIVYLDSGEPVDLEITRRDLECLMTEIRPVSITIHHNYLVPRSLKKREAMIHLLDDMVHEFPDYRCVNSLLTGLGQADIQRDIDERAEYRLMRRDENFYFYMSTKQPTKGNVYGYNTLALGGFKGRHPVSSFYYVNNVHNTDLLEEFESAHRVCRDFIRIRQALGLAHGQYIPKDGFFADESGRAKFKEAVKVRGIPYYSFDQAEIIANIQKARESVHAEFDI